MVGIVEKAPDSVIGVSGRRVVNPNIKDLIRSFMRDKDKEYLLSLGDELDNARRSGSEMDDPEGNRYIILSDTLAVKIAQELRKLVKEN